MDCSKVVRCAIWGTGASLAFIHSAFAASRTDFDILADQEALAGIFASSNKRACDWPSQVGHVRCDVHVIADAAGRFAPMAPGSQRTLGLTPSDLQSAYKLPSTGGTGKIVAVVDAFDAPTIESDLVTYRSTFNLPPCASATGCFRKVDQRGGSSFPAADSNWAAEISLDVEMVSAVCPDCRIVLLEADSDTNTDIAQALVTAIGMGVDAISNSFGAPEDPNETLMDKEYYSAVQDAGSGASGILVTVSSGDSAYGANYPATSRYVVAVGGTTLTQSSSSRGWAEAAWAKGGSGCSAYIGKPSWQTDPSCAKRMEADLAAVADTSTPVLFYCSDCETPDGGNAGNGADSGSWYGGGGTSVAAPIVAGGFMALGVRPAAGTTWPQFVWMSHSAFYDVTSGQDGVCGTSYFCTAGVGYDGPTGWGTIDGDLLSQLAGLTDGGPGGGTGIDGSPNGSVDAAEAGDGGSVKSDAGVAKPDAGYGSQDASISGSDAGIVLGDGGRGETQDAVAFVDAKSPSTDSNNSGGASSLGAASELDASTSGVGSSSSSGASGTSSASEGGNGTSKGCGCAIGRTHFNLAGLASDLVIAGAMVRRRRSRKAARE